MADPERTESSRQAAGADTVAVCEEAASKNRAANIGVRRIVLLFPLKWLGVVREVHSRAAGRTGEVWNRLY
jgi:hypothetical protein